MEIKSGKILIAEPFMLDPNFKRSVILITEHADHGTTGFILNKPIEVKINELVGDFPASKIMVYLGGPVGLDSLHYLHNVGDLIDNSVEVCPGIFWGGDFEKLKFLLENGVIQEHNIRFFMGYSGWSEGQLEEEMQGSSWLIEDMDVNYLFKIKPFVLWQTVLSHKGDTYTVIAQMPEGSDLN